MSRHEARQGRHNGSPGREPGVCWPHPEPEPREGRHNESVNLDDTDFSSADLTDAILNKKTDAQIQFENHPDKGRQVRVIGNRTWVEPYIGKTGVLQGYSQSINGHEILLDSGEVLELYPEEFEFI